MQKAWAIFEREVKSYFVSPIAYVVMAMFIALSGIFFYLILSTFIQRCYEVDLYAKQWQQMTPPMNIHEWITRPFFNNVALFALMILPLMTMKLISEEKKTGTIELLQSSPITSFQIIIGKYTAVLFVYLIMLIFTSIYMVFLFLFGNPEIGQILSGYLGMFLIGGSYLAIGLVFSTFTDNQIIAGVSTIAAILLFWSVGWLTGFLNPSFGKIMGQLSLIEHFDSFAKGVINAKHIVFYVSFIFLGLYFSYVSVESARWRGSQ